MDPNQVYFGNCIDLITQLDDNSVQAVITSPPYAEQRKKQYGGIAEVDYPMWFTSIMAALHPKMKENGSVLVVIRSNVWNGEVSDYVLRTRLAVREAGWIECEELVWYKPNSPPLGSRTRFRRAHEQILFFSKSRQPFMNLTAGGNPNSKRKGFENGYERFGTLYEGNERIDKTGKTNDDVMVHGISKGIQTGASRRTDVFVAGVSENAKGIDHPAIYPVTLCNQLVESFSNEGDLILDPFVGSGTTLLSARYLKRNYIGFDISQEYVDLSKSRLDGDEWKPKPPSPFDDDDELGGEQVGMIS